MVVAPTQDEAPAPRAAPSGLQPTGCHKRGCPQARATSRLLQQSSRDENRPCWNAPSVTGVSPRVPVMARRLRLINVRESAFPCKIFCTQGTLCLPHDVGSRGFAASMRNTESISNEGCSDAASDVATQSEIDASLLFQTSRSRTRPRTTSIRIGHRTDRRPSSAPAGRATGRSA
jgi:hypothetical protein